MTAGCTVNGSSGSGPLGVMLTNASGRLGIHWLLGGTVTDAALLQAAHDLATGARPKAEGR